MRRRARRALVVLCHPDPESYVAALATRAVSALQARGHEVRFTDLHADGLAPELTVDEWEHHLDPGTHPAVRHHAEDLLWCDTLVLVYPTWWSGQPALLKGWIDRVWASGVAWELPDGANRLHGRLRNVRRIVAITTHGSGKLVNAFEGEAGKRTVTRSLRVLCHPLCRTNWWAIYGLDVADDRHRQTFLDRIDRRCRRL
jgi:NAD(P)H dehydrogenase (quinone)